MDDNQFDPGDVAGPARLIGSVFGLTFLGIGLTVIGFLWGAPFGEFGSPPLFFRIFGSFIAVPIVVMGGTIAYAAITGKPQRHLRNRLGALKRARERSKHDQPNQQAAKDGYSCPSCGAPLDSNADVSPHGDAKCGHCDRWFNVHGK